MTERIAAPKADELSWLKQNVIIFFNGYYCPKVNFLVVLSHWLEKKKGKKKESQETVLSGNHVSLTLHDVILSCSEQ